MHSFKISHMVYAVHKLFVGALHGNHKRLAVGNFPCLTVVSRHEDASTHEIADIKHIADFNDA